MPHETLEEFLEGLRRFRDDYAERFQFDLEAIFRDLNERGRDSGREYVTPPPRRIIADPEIPPVDCVEAVPTAEPGPTASRGS